MDQGKLQMRCLRASAFDLPVEPRATSNDGAFVEFTDAGRCALPKFRHSVML
jgi:hypothetical protein